MIRTLRTFLAVQKYGTFAGAGQQLGLTQSAVSAQMRQLEEALGVSLFNRVGRKASLTPAGEQALKLSSEILALYEKMENLNRLNEGAELQGTLKLGIIASLKTLLIPQILQALMAQSPKLSVQLEIGNSLPLLAQVERGELDVAVILTPPFDCPKDMVVRSVFQQPYCLIVSEEVARRYEQAESDAAAGCGTEGKTDEMPQYLKILQHEPFIRYESMSVGDRQVRQFFRQHQLTPTEVLEVNDVGAIVAMVTMGVGVALVPQAETWHNPQQAEAPQDSLRGIRMLPLGKDTFYRGVSVVMQQRQRQSAILTRFMQCVQNQVALFNDAKVNDAKPVDD